MKTIIAELIEKAEEEISKELTRIEQDIEDFVSPLEVPSFLEPKKRTEYFEERLTGRLSSAKLRENHVLKLRLLNQLSEITNFRYHNPQMFKD